MLQVLGESLGACGAAILLFAPGLLIVLCLPRDTFPARMIMPVAFILSPGVIALELAAATLAGAPFALFAPSAAATNLVAATALLLYVRPRISFAVPLAWLVTAALIFIPFAMLVLDLPQRRAYGWHNMLQVAAIHSIYDLPRPPEDLGLAGTNLNYGWLGWAQVAAIAKLVDKAPTLLFLPLNLAQFGALVLVLCEATAALGATAQRASNRMIAMGVGAALLSPGLCDIAAYLLFKADLWTWLGEVRITPPVNKYTNMDLMALGLSAVALAIYAMIRAVQSRQLGHAILMPIAALTACLVYPLFFPSCILLGGAYLLATSLAPSFPQWRVAAYTLMERGAVVLAWVLCVALVAAYLGFLGQDAARPPVVLRPIHYALARTAKLFWILLVVDGLLAFALYRAWQERSGITLMLVLTAAAAQVAFLLFRMPVSVEYKFLYVSLLVSTPVAAAAALAWAEAGRQRRTAMVGAFAAMLGACLLVTPSWHQPALPLADALDESHAEIARKETGASWLRAVREETPDDAVLLSGATDKPIAVFASRALYLCADTLKKTSKEAQKLERIGYTMSCSTELEGVKGYDTREISHRAFILERALADHISPAETSDVMDALRRLGRPIVLHTSARSGFQAWLEDHRIGRAIFDTATDRVWLIDRADLEKALAALNGVH